METNNKNNKTQYPEKTGKIPASGVISETYKEEVNPQDELGSTSLDPNDPEESQNSREDDINTYPLEEANIPEEDVEVERDDEDNFNNIDEDIDQSDTDDDEFLK